MGPSINPVSRINASTVADVHSCLDHLVFGGITRTTGVVEVGLWWQKKDAVVHRYGTRDHTMGEGLCSMASTSAHPSGRPDSYFPFELTLRSMVSTTIHAIHSRVRLVNT